MAITPEIAKADLEKIMGQFGSAGEGTPKDRAAQLLLQTVGVLSRRLGSPDIIKMLYVDNPEAQALLPETVHRIATEYVNGTMSRSEAGAQLEQAEEQYRAVLAQACIVPTRATMLFYKG